MEPKRSFFMRGDESASDYGREAILDYEISWVLRLTAEKKEKECRPKLYSQCRHILCKLLGIELDSVEVLDVKVWKQRNNIDIFSTIKLINNGKEECYVLLTEDKVYTQMGKNQRDDYPQIAKDWCDSNSEWANCKLRLCAITCQDRNTPAYNKLVEFCKQSSTWEWNVFSLEDLSAPNAEELTESDLFNEFWLSSW